MTFRNSIVLPDTVYSFLVDHNLKFEYGITKFQNDIPELKTFISSFCNNTALAIGDAYMDEVFENLQTTAHFEIIFVLYDNKITTEFEKKDLYKIVGFMITQKGECTKAEYQNIPALNLICIDKTKSVAPLPTAKLLLFLYTYTLLKNDFSYGLLELAYNYKNISGLKLYSKFGFRETLSLKLHCFNYFLTEIGDIRSMNDKKNNILTQDDTLPMTVELMHITTEQLVDALIENKYIEYKLKDLDPLCLQKIVNIKDVNKRRQILIKIINIKRLPENLQRENKLKNGIPVNASLGVLFDSLSHFAQKNERIHFVQYVSPPKSPSPPRQRSSRRCKQTVAVESTTQRKRKLVSPSTTERKRKVVSPTPVSL